MPETQEDFIRRVTQDLEGTPFNPPGAAPYGSGSGEVVTEYGDLPGGTPGDWGGEVGPLTQAYASPHPEPSLVGPQGGVDGVRVPPPPPSQWDYGPTRADMPFGGPRSAGDFYGNIFEQVRSGQMTQQQADARMRAYNVERNPNYGQDQGHEAGLIQAQRALAGATLSPAEQIRSQNLRNGLSTIQQQLDNGTITPNQAAELQQQVQQAGQPLWVRESQIPHLMMRQQFQHAQHRAAMEASIQQQNDQFRARTAQGRFATVVATDPITGEQHAYAEISPGRYEPLRPEGDQAGRQEAQVQQRQEQQHARLVTHFTTEVRRELQAANRPVAEGQPPRERAEWMSYAGEEGPVSPELAQRNEIQRRLAAHYALTGTSPPTPRTGGQPGGQQQPGATPGQQGPAPQPGNTPAANLEAFNALTQQLMSAPAGGGIQAQPPPPAARRNRPPSMWEELAQFVGSLGSPPHPGGLGSRQEERRNNR